MDVAVAYEDGSYYGKVVEDLGNEVDVLFYKFEGKKGMLSRTDNEKKKYIERVKVIYISFTRMSS